MPRENTDDINTAENPAEDDDVLVMDRDEEPDTQGEEPEQEVPDKDKAQSERVFTQDDLDRVVKERLKRQERQIRKQYADYEELKELAEKYREIENEKLSEAERWERERSSLLSRANELEQKLKKVERERLIADLATEAGLPKSLWGRVQGDDEDEIAEDIQALVKDLGLTKDKQQAQDGKSRSGGSKRMYGGGGDHEEPDPDVDAIVARIPRGAQIRIDKSSRIVR